MNPEQMNNILKVALQKLKERHANSECDLSLAHAQIELLQYELSEIKEKYQSLEKQHDELVENLKNDEEQED
jgi:FtsZ-binding cell division protein ZapB